MCRLVWVVGVFLLMAFNAPEAWALIRGGAGNEVLPDHGWPAGAAALFNDKGRIAWWEGPPFGGGQWHSECRGDARALSQLLEGFARLPLENKRLVVHDGIGHSFWLAPNGEKEKLDDARIDWVLMVWDPRNWQRLRNLPADLNPTDPADDSPPVQIDIYTGRLRWDDLKVPEGLKVDDQRLESHGFTQADSSVFEGKVVDLATGQPLPCTVQLQSVETRQKGGYVYPVLSETKADAQGRWVFKKVQPGWVRVVVTAEGFAPRVVGYAKPDGQPSWQAFHTSLVKAGQVTGRVLDADGKALAGVDVRLDNVTASAGGRYESLEGYTTKTDAEGRFRVDGVPLGKASVWVQKSGYCRPGLGLPVTIPADSIELRMEPSASVRVTVDFAGKVRPEGYLVAIEPEGENGVGTFGGSGNINAENRITFENVPPGRYVFYAQPNPGSSNERTDPVTVELKGGTTLELTLKAR